MSQEKNTKGKILEERIYFLVEIIIIFVGSFFFLIIPTMLLPTFISEDSEIYAPLYFLIKAILTVILIPIFIYVVNYLLQDRFVDSKQPKNITPASGYIKLFKVSRKNLKYQLLYGLIFLFILFIPLDFFTYLLVPEVIEYQAAALTSNSLGNYFSEDYSIFLISAVFIHISVAIVEESLARGLITKRGSEHFNKISAVLIASIYFGFGHFAYLLNPISANFSIWIPFLWFLESLLVGIVFSLFIIKKKWIFPLIFAHALNNIISAHTIWSFKQGYQFITITLYLYIPLLIISLFILVLQFSRIKEGLSNGIRDFMQYFKNDIKTEETASDKIFRFFIDIGLGILIFLIGMFIT